MSAVSHNKRESSMGLQHKLLILAGGTGGHVYPALAVALALRTQGWSIDWVGTQRGLESRIVPANNIPLHCLGVSGLRGKGLLARMAGAARLVVALFEALAVVRRIKPDVVLGMGGYVAGPAGVAAWLLRRPLVIHEQNAVAGTTNRMLAPLARRVLCGLPGAFGAAVGSVVGNPVRADIAALAAPASVESDAASVGVTSPAPNTPVAFTLQRPLRLAVLGGSLGSMPLNAALPAALASLAATERACIEVRHQCGPQHEAATHALYEQCAGVQLTLLPYVDHMAHMYRWADVVICRAGALTVAELAVSGTPSVLVPLPHAIDDHQTANARALSSCGGAHLLPQADMTPERLAALLTGFMAEPQTLFSMGDNARAAAFPDATQSVAQAVQEVACVA